MDYNDPIQHFSYKPTIFALLGEMQAVIQKKYEVANEG